MIHVKVLFLFALFLGAMAWGNGNQGQDQNFGGNYEMKGRSQGRGMNYGGDMMMMGRMARQNGGGMDAKKYRSNLYNDDDVYGYDAYYPNGEAVYINYKTKDARARRGPEFARTSRAYSRNGRQGPGGAMADNGQRNGGAKLMSEGSMW